jgi:hypothetical protein
LGDAFPYVMAPAAAVRGGAWTTDVAGATCALPEWLPYWDLSQSLRLARRLEIDMDDVYRETGVPISCRLGVSVVFASEFEGEAYGVTFELGGGTVSADVRVEIPGTMLGPIVRVTTALVLRDEAPELLGPVAWRRGSVLWSDLKTVRLYGDSSQFPVTEVDFGDCGLDPASPWFLEISSELELPAMGGIHLLLNSRFPIVAAAARPPDPDRPELAVVRSQLLTDVGRTLVEFALAREDIGLEWPEESLGAVLSMLLRSHFRETFRDLRTLRAQDASMWSAKVAAAFGLLREPLR